MTVVLAPTTDEARRLARVAQGAEPADLVLRGGTLVDVYTEELLDGWGVAVAGERIAYVGPDADERAGPRTEVVDVAGRLVAPGLIDAHTHLIGAWLPETMAAHVRAGVTSLMLDMVEVANTAGGEVAMRALMEEARAVPGRAFLAVPAEGGIDPQHERRLGPPSAWASLLDHELAIGVGEVNWSFLLRDHPRAEAMIAAAHARGLGVEGHGAGARPAGLNAMAAYGIASDHEGISADDALARIRLGLYALLRVGATRADDLDAYKALWAPDAPALDFSRLGFVTDGVAPRALADGRLLNAVVVAAVATGLPPARAIRMASRTAAERHGIGRWLGGIGPGMLADLVVSDGVEGLLDPQLVLVGGRRPELPPAASPTLAPVRLDLGAFDRALLECPGHGRWRAIRVAAPLVTREAESDGEDALALVVIDRADPRRAFRGLLLDYGLRRGAVALTSAWEGATVVAVGCSAAELEVAIERVAAIGGGAVVVDGERVVAEWRAEIGGIFSRAPAERIAADVGAVDAALAERGCPWAEPLLTLETLTGGAIPFLRIAPSGYVRIKDGARLGLDVEADPRISHDAKEPAR